MRPHGTLAACLPAFRLERCGWAGDEVVVLVATGRQRRLGPEGLTRLAGGAERVVALSPAARAQGLDRGMTLAAARAVCPGVKVERLDAAAERADLDALAVAMGRHSPKVAVDPPDCLVFDGGPELLRPVREQLARLGHGARLVWAPLAGAATLLARHGERDRVLRAEDCAPALAPLRLDALDLDDEVLAALHDVGVRSFGAFAKLPPSALAGRFGRGLLPLHHLARGQEPPAELPAPPPGEDTRFRVELPDPVTELPALLFVLNGLVHTVCERLEGMDPAAPLSDAPPPAERRAAAAAGAPRREGPDAPLGAAAARLQLRLGLEEGELYLPIRLGRPGREPARIFRLLRARLDRVKLASPITTVEIELAEVVPLRPSQPGLADRAEAAEELDELLVRLQDTLGAEVVTRAELRSTHRPEAAWRALPVATSSPPTQGSLLGGAPPPLEGADPDATGLRRGLAPDPAAAHEPPRPVPPRPPLLLPVASPLRVLTAPSGRPRMVQESREWVKVEGAEGPERLTGAWWGREPLGRDYWRLQLADGRRAWVYREGAAEDPADGRWYLHGFFDGEPPPARGPADRGPRSPPGARPPPGAPPVRGPAAYAELVCRSNFSFCEGASHPEELVNRAKELGLAGLALTDRDGLYGAVQAHRAAKAAGLKLVHGALVTVALGAPEPGAAPGSAPRAGSPTRRAPPATASLVVLVMDRRGWASLCRLLTHARLGGADLDDVPDHPDVPPDALTPHDPLKLGPAPPDRGPPPRGQLPAGLPVEKGFARVPFEDLPPFLDGLLLLLRGEWPEAAVERLHGWVGDRLYRAVSRRLDPDELEHLRRLVAGPVPCVATNDVLMHSPSRQPLQDVLTCIRLNTTLSDAGRRLQPNAERCLVGPEVMARRFAPWPELVARSVELLDRCHFSLDELDYRYPREVVPPGYSAQAWLVELCRRGVYERYGGEPPVRVLRQVRYELDVIERLDFPSYFLTVHDAVAFARRRGILCQGRGSAANSAVCFVLGITPVDPATSDLLFERFISEERAEPPDIDVDFEHERREEVLQYVYERYGRHRAAMVNEIIAWRGRSAVRDVGRALGFGVDQVEQLATLTGSWGQDKLDRERLREGGFDADDPLLAHLAAMVKEIHGFPRHTSIHVGGFVISDDPLVETAPLEPARMDGRTVLQWDKNDVDDLRFVKVDFLSLGMLSAVRKTFGFLRQFHGIDHDLATIPREDPAVYDMLCAADSIGVFQVESRAQQSMLPRLKPRNFYDLVVEVAIVRPGPIQGGMVHPYLRRRNGEEPIFYVDERLRPILERTMGVPIFQEQVMAMAVAVGGFTPGEADRLRRAMGAWRKRGGLGEIGAKLMDGMAQNGIPPHYAEQIFKQIQGFAEYGFPESHACAFAHLVYVSSWLRCHHLAAFTAALINSQPMGFYAPRTLVADAQRHGVEVREVDVCVSEWDCGLEDVSSPAVPARLGPEGDEERAPARPLLLSGAERGARTPALRLGLRLVRGFKEASARRLVEERRRGPFRDIPDLARRTGLGAGDLRLLARADALRGLVGRVTKGDRVRQAVWEVEGLWGGLFAGLRREEPEVALPEASALEVVQADFAATGLSVRRHPLEVARPRLDRQRFVPAERLGGLASGTVVRVAGLVSHRQRPGTASGVVFMTLEDETGSANIVVWPKVFDRQDLLIRTEKLLCVQGKLEREGDVMNVIAWRFWALDLREGEGPEDERPSVRASSRDFR